MTQPSDILFQSISVMTGGLITDLQTAMLGMVALGFIVMAIDYLKDTFEASLHQKHSDKYIENARFHKFAYENESDSTLRDVHKAKYRANIRKASL